MSSEGWPGVGDREGRFGVTVCCPRRGPRRLSRGKRQGRTIKQPCFSRQALLAGIMKKNWICEGS